MLLCFWIILDAKMSWSTGLGLLGATAIGGGVAIARWKVSASRRYGVVWRVQFAVCVFECLFVLPMKNLGFYALVGAALYFILHAVIGVVMTIAMWLSSRVIHKPT
jgi:hypothetical protein